MKLDAGGLEQALDVLAGHRDLASIPRVCLPVCRGTSLTYPKVVSRATTRRSPRHIVNRPSVILVALALLTTPVLGQSADRLVLEGRGFLAARDLANANNRFQAAVTTAPDHETANVLYAATRLLVLPNQSASEALLDRLGVALTNRTIYHWTAKPPVDTNGVPIPPNQFCTGEAVAFLRTNVLPEITAAAANLARVTDTNFILALASNETCIAAVQLDYGDVRMMRSTLHALEFATYTLNTYDLEAQLNAIYNLYTRRQFTLEDLLTAYPQALTFRTTNDFAAARQAFKQAVDDYLLASAFIRLRPTNIVRLFNYDPEMAEQESTFRQTLSELAASLSAPVVLGAITNVTNRLTVCVGRLYDAKAPPRAFLPSIQGNGFILGSLPDISLNGLIVIEGVYLKDIEAFLSRALNPLPIIRSVESLASGAFSFEVSVLPDRVYAVQRSDNLVTWTELAVAHAHDSLLAYDDVGPGRGGPRFYRVADLSEYVAFEGVVVEAGTRNPLPGAAVSSPRDNRQVVTDPNGAFLLVTSRKSARAGFYELFVTMPGFADKHVSGYYSGGSFVQDLVIEMKRP